MATVEKIVTDKPTVQSATLKLTRSELSDMKVFIGDWFTRNYGSSAAHYRDKNTVYKSVVSALDGKGAETVTAPAYATF